MINCKLPVSVVCSLLDSDELDTSSVVESIDKLDASLVPSDPAAVLEMPSVSDEAFDVASVFSASVDAELSVDPELSDDAELDSVADSETPVESLESVDCDDDSSVEALDSVEPLPSISPDPSYVDAANNIRLAHDIRNKYT